ncbi:MAG: preprotein translocase subunit SecA [Candidatus Paceibacterota bacterium]|nr:MAG: preprotein translocase subunit SecA [Candidatus Paceibacterota bacterium]
MPFLKKILGDESGKIIKKILPKIEKINSLESHFSSLSDDALKLKTAEFKNRLSQGETLDDLLPEAFAAVRESAKRVSNQRHFDVQLIGGVVLHQGDIAEMKTGEGKTLVATLPAYLNAISGRGVHVVTVNDYLARRDAVWMGQIYDFLGMSVGCINHDASYLYDPAHKDDEKKLDEKRDEVGGFKVVHEFLKPCGRKDAYLADITYGTNNEFGFDYLRDNLEYDLQNVRQRDFNYAIVDEVDSILIDEARTPLIISAPSGEAENLYRTFSGLVRQMKRDEDFEVDEKLKAITLTDKGIDKAEKLLGVKNIYTDEGIKLVHHLENAVKAKALFERDVDYVVKEGEIIIVDHFTGRLQPGRRWSGGLHQAIEAKEGVRIQQESRTFASITFQNYFRMYKKLSGMTGTALTSQEEFFRVYGLNTIAIPTNRPSKRIDRNDLIFQTEKGKLQAIARKVKELHQKGQPVLIGTISIEKNEMISEYLRTSGVPHEILNAKNHEREGEIIAQAGRRGGVTIATNMAGRGVDIKLGGNPGTPENSEEIKNLGGLFVLGTERHEARRIDNQLRGRSGRQGDPGETQFFVSLEDSLMRVFAKDTVKKLMGRMGIAEDEPIENRLITRSLETAQTKIEGFNFDARKHVLEYDDVLNFQRKIVYDRRRKILSGDRQFIDEFLGSVAEVAPEVGDVSAKKKQELGEEAFFLSVRSLVLQGIDFLWVDHLEAMDYLRSSVNLRAYGQRDPLVEYKKEGLRMFKEMERTLKEQVFSAISSVNTQTTTSPKPSPSKLILSGPESSSVDSSSKKTGKKSTDEKVGRNDPCPCGSGKKYKKCHGS